MGTGYLFQFTYCEFSYCIFSTLINPLYTGNPLTRTFSYGEDPDEMQHNMRGSRGWGAGGPDPPD